MRARLTALVTVTVLLAACAARTPPAVPATLRYPDFVYPVVPRDLQGPAGERVEWGWRFLQNGDLRNANREFAAAMKRSPAFYPARAGEGYVALARRDYEDALEAFDAALARNPKYVPALVGRGQALLERQRIGDALGAFQAALAVDPSLTDVRRRVDVLRLRGLQDIIERARTHAAAGRLDEARTAYRQAVESSPESPFLHRELGIVERRRGDVDAALAELRRAVEMDPSDAAAWVQIGELLDTRLDYAGAVDAYRKAAEIDPSEDLSARIAATEEKAREARLPAEFRAIPQSEHIRRGELAALIGIRMDALLRSAPSRQVVITDVRGHWAGPWITLVARAGVMDPFPNHTFAPRTRVQRADLAAAVSRLLRLLARTRPELRARLDVRPAIADVGPGHLSYPAVAVAVASGAMPLLDGERFGVTRPVSGAEAVRTVERLLALAGGDSTAAPVGR